MATGLRDELPDVPGLRERWARDVLHCPYCHGFEVRGQALGVLGGNPGAAGYAQVVRQWSADLTFVAPPMSITRTERHELAARAIAVVDGTAQELIVESDRLTGIRLEDGRTLAIAVLFVPPRFVPHDLLLTDAGCRREADGWVEVDPAGRTSVPGLYAAGNVVDRRAQLITAAGAGSATAIAVNSDLVIHEVRDAIDRFSTNHCLDAKDLS